MKTSIIPVFIPHEGCPNQCSFCNQKKISGAIGSPTAEEIEKLVREYQTADVSKGYDLAFYGGSFTALTIAQQQYYLEIAAKCKKQKRIRSIRFSTRPDAINDQVLNLAASYGVETIELGVQSMDNYVLTLANRGHTAQQVTEAAEMIKKRGFQLGLQFMPGLPGDSRQRIANTVAELISLKPDFVRIYPAVVIKDTMLARQYLQGTFIPFPLEEMVAITAEAYLGFLAAGIHVVRMGLQATDLLHPEKDLLAGPYHPAFGELVKSHIFYMMITELIERNAWQKLALDIEISSKDVSKVLGQKKQNTEKIQADTGCLITIRQILEGNPGQITIFSKKQSDQITCKEFAEHITKTGVS